jgi:hypothetical protein
LTIRESRKLSTKLTLQHGQRQYLLRDEPQLRALIGQSIVLYVYRDGNVELCHGGVTLPYSTLECAKRHKPIEVDDKTVHHEVDQLAPQVRQRARNYRLKQPAKLNTLGVMTAKKVSSHKRTSVL